MAVEWSKLLSLDKLLEVLIKLRWLQLGGVFVCAVLITSVKIDRVRAFFGLQELEKSTAVLFVIGVLCVGLAASSWLTDWHRRTSKGKRYRKALYDLLKKLTEDEKDTLRSYLVERKRTAHFEMTAGVANSLEVKQILYRSSSVSVGLTCFAYTIQDVAYDILMEHPEYLTEAGSSPGEKDG